LKGVANFGAGSGHEGPAQLSSQ
jgi:hypothetical protein